jgi:hypothetical protein
MELTIEKAKLIKQGEKVEITFKKQSDNGIKSTGGELFHAVPHPDLKTAFEALTIHFCLMTGQVPVKMVKDVSNYKPEIIEGFRVSSYSIGGDREGITITGTRLLPNGKAFNSNTPYYKFEESDQTRYTFMDELIEDLETLESELKQYVSGSKLGNEQQLNMFEPPVTKMQIAAPDKPVFKSEPKDTDGLHDVTEEYIEHNKKHQEAKLKIPPADPEAMARVAAGGIEDAEVLEEIPNKKKKKELEPRKKKVPQSATAPGGEIEEPAE